MKSVSTVPRQVLRTLARRLLYPALEELWAVLILAARSLLRPSARELLFTGSDRVLVVAPHPDDETLACGGTIIKHARVGDRVSVLVATDGGMSRAGGRSREAMILARADESREAIARLHPAIKLTLGGLPEGYCDAMQLRSLLRESIDALQPTLIYAPSCVDFHPEHIKVARALADVLGDISSEQLPRVRVYELQVPLSTPLVNCMARIGPQDASKQLALGKYRTQYQSFVWHHRQQRYLRKWFGVPEAVEVFMGVDAPQYVQMVRYASRLRPTFRSIRSRPFADGLAWLVGTRARFKLHEQIRSRQRYMQGHPE